MDQESKMWLCLSEPARSWGSGRRCKGAEHPRIPFKQAVFLSTRVLGRGEKKSQHILLALEHPPIVPANRKIRRQEDQKFEPRLHISVTFLVIWSRRVRAQGRVLRDREGSTGSRDISSWGLNWPPTLHARGSGCCAQWWPPANGMVLQTRASLLRNTCTDIVRFIKLLASSFLPSPLAFLPLSQVSRSQSSLCTADSPASALWMLSRCFTTQLSWKISLSQKEWGGWGIGEGEKSLVYGHIYACNHSFGCGGKGRRA